MVMLGNLSVKEIEKELDITLSDEDKEFFKNTRQQIANNIAKGKWHCFHLPFVIVCGDEETAIKVRDILLPHEKKMKGQIQITWPAD